MIRISKARVDVLIGAAAAVSTLLAIRPSLAQAPTGQPVALIGARVIDGTGRPPMDRATIVVADGRIDALGPADTVKVPAGATRIDMTGKTIMPGMINAHAHLNVDSKAKAPVRDQLVQRLRTYAEYGVTSAVSLGSTPTDEMEGVRLRDEQTRGPLDRARVFTGGLNACRLLSVDCKTPEDARKSVDRLADLKVDLIKFHINGVPTDMTPDVWGAIIDEGHKKGLPVFVHIFYLKDAQATVARGVDVIAHSIRDQDVPQRFVNELKMKHVAYIPTLTRDLSVFTYSTRPAFFDEPFFKRGMSLYRTDVQILSDPAHQEQVRKDPQSEVIRTALQQAEKNLKALTDGGVLMAMGTDSGVANNPGRWQGYFEHVEIEMMQQAGLTPMQAIVAATNGAARAARIDAHLGTIARGKWADLLVLNANPLDDIRNARQIDSVWMAGRRLTMTFAQTN